MHANNEIVPLALTISVIVALIIYRRQFTGLPRWKLLLASFAFFAAASLVAVLATLLLPELIEHVEHFCLLTGIALLTIWSWLIFVKRSP